MPAFAHQGGWDELLFVAIPIVVFAGLLWVANRRAAGLERDDQDSGAEGTGGTDLESP